MTHHHNWPHRECQQMVLASISMQISNSLGLGICPSSQIKQKERHSQTLISLLRTPCSPYQSLFLLSSPRKKCSLSCLRLILPLGLSPSPPGPGSVSTIHSLTLLQLIFSLYNQYIPSPKILHKPTTVTVPFIIIRLHPHPPCSDKVPLPKQQYFQPNNTISLSWVPSLPQILTDVPTPQVQDLIVNYHCLP